jgi:hypothetical protein
LFWSELTTWQFQSGPDYGNYVDGVTFQLPPENSNVLIPANTYIVADIALPTMKTLRIEGFLELDPATNNKLQAEIIFINGGQLIVGFEDTPVTANVDIVLKGTRGSINYTLPDGIGNIGGKAIGVYGGLDLHGAPRYPTWTQLKSTAQSGTNQIVLNKAVDWKVGESIMIATTSTIANQSEVFQITQKLADNQTLVLSGNLAYTHLCVSENGALKYSICAAVGLLTRNIRIIGESYPSQAADLYGFRILASEYSIYDSVNNFQNSFKGYVRVSNAEFVRFGQYNKGTGDDNTYGILLNNLGNQNWSRPSYVNNSAFHDGFSAAVGVLSTSGVPIANNVVYKAIERGIRVGAGNSNNVTSNLVAMTYWVSSFLAYQAVFDVFSFPAIDVHESDSVVLENNYVAGAERIGYWLRGKFNIK